MFIDDSEIIDTEGLIKPVFSSKSFDREELCHVSRAFILSLISDTLLSRKASRWCDDTPINFKYASFLLELFPDAKMIHMVRDPRDVITSYQEKLWASKSLIQTIQRLKLTYQELMKVEQKHDNAEVIVIRLEDFVNDHQNEVQKLCNFLAIDSNDFDGSVQISSKSLGRWKNQLTNEQCNIVETELNFVLEHYNYSE